MLDHVTYQFGSGNAFFIGAGLILAAVALSIVADQRRAKYGRDLCGVVGILFVTLAAAPLPWWIYVVLGLVTLVWLWLEVRSSEWVSTYLAYSRAMVVCLWLSAIAYELPYHVMPSIPAQKHLTLFVIGDSVSAGMGEVEHTWPKVFADERHIAVRNLAKIGATARSARLQAENLGDEPGLVLLEIGGNDLLGTSSADQFETDLEHLLISVCRPSRTVVMLELPLPPFTNRYGMIQRRLARQYDVILVPKRFFIGLLTTSDATVDGIHLSGQGRALMANAIWRLMESAYSHTDR